MARLEGTIYRPPDGLVQWADHGDTCVGAGCNILSQPSNEPKHLYAQNPMQHLGPRSAQRVLTAGRASVQRRVLSMSAVAPSTAAAETNGHLVQTLAQSAGKVPPLTAAFLTQSLENYLHTTPSAAATVAALTTRGHVAPHTMAHDHYAYRTLGLPGLGIASLAAVLEQLGYRQEEAGLLFPAKKLTASWFAYRPSGVTGSSHSSSSDPHPLPRIFVSEIQVEKLSPSSQNIIRKYVDGLALSPAQVAVACTCGAVPWGEITRDEYDTLLAESDYAAWVMVHGYRLNHTALAVHAMRTPQGGHLRLEQAADAVSEHGLTMNQDGGRIKVSGDGLLRQCSSMSDWVVARFGDGNGGQVPGSYLELVERLPLPQYADLKLDQLKEHHRRDGFEVSNASHLFTSTRATV